MSDSVLPAESEPIGLVSSGLATGGPVSCALVCAITLGVGFVAEAAADRNVLVALTFLVAGERSASRCSIFCSVGGRIHWHLRLVWARQLLSLPCSCSPSLSCLGWTVTWLSS